MKKRFYDWYVSHFYRLDKPNELDWTFAIAFVGISLFFCILLYITLG